MLKNVKELFWEGVSGYPGTPFLFHEVTELGPKVVMFMGFYIYNHQTDNTPDCGYSKNAN